MTMRGTSFLALLSSALIAVAVVAQGDRLCMTDGRCQEFTCGTAIEAANARHPFTLIKNDGTYWLGIAQPMQTVISCETNGEIHLRLAPSRIAPGAAIHVNIRDDHGNRWTVALTELQLRKPVKVGVARGTYEVTLETPHFQRVLKTIEVKAAPAEMVVHFERLPTIEGMVFAGGRPAAGGLIRSDTGAEVLIDATGRFLIEVNPEEWPRQISISAAGYADATREIPPARANTALGAIHLTAGGSAVVVVEQPKPGGVTLLELQELREGGRKLGRTVAKREVSPIDQRVTIRFDDVEAGSYLILASGHESWERRAEKVEIIQGFESSVALNVAPFQLRMRTRNMGRGLANSVVRLRQRDLHWEAFIPTDDDGEALIHLWQGGRMSCTVRAEGITPYVERRAIDDGNDTDWVLDLPDLEVTGVVVDAASGTPVPRAALALQMRADEGFSVAVTARSDDQGAFRFGPVLFGTHTLSAAAEGYAPVETSYRFAEAESSHKVTLRLDAGATCRVTIVDHRGNPAVDVPVMDFRGLTRTGYVGTDGSGTALVLVPEGETRDVYVVPRDGSLGFTTLRAGVPKATLRFAEGSSRIILRAESDKGAPIPNVAAVIRYEGRILPMEVLAALVGRGSRTSSGPDGRIILEHMPPGSYEFWPVGSSAEAQWLASSGLGPQAPLRLAAVPGENVAVMTFAAAR